MKDSINRSLAVALSYPKGADAPFITAKEHGFLARRMLALAEENDIPVVEDEVLANVLSLKDIGTCIPVQTWEAVSRIFALIIDMEKKK